MNPVPLSDISLPSSACSIAVSPTTGSERPALQGPLAGLAFQTGDDLGGAFEKRIGGARSAVVVERGAIVFSGNVNEAAAGERAEVARLQRQDAIDVGEGAVVLVKQVEHGRPFVPA